MKKVFYLLLLAFTALGAQAGKMEETGFRLYGGLFTGSLSSDFENRLRVQSLLGGSSESTWSGGSAPGLNLGGQFFLKSPNEALSGWMFRYELESASSEYTSTTIGNGFFSSNAYSLSQGKGDLSAGAVFNLSELIRITPRFGIRSLSQTLDGGSAAFLSPGFVGFGGTSINANAQGGTLGFLLEYDYKPGITFYLDSIQISPFLLNTKGTYSYGDSALILASNGNLIGLNGYSGSYSASFSKFSIGTSVEIVPKVRIFAQLENEIIESKIKTDSALRYISLTVEDQSASGVSITGAYLTSLLSNSGKDSTVLNGLRAGASIDF